MFRYAPFLLLLACQPKPGDPDPVDSGTPTYVTPDGTCSDGSAPTDTLPAFCGEIPKNLIFISMDTFRKDHIGHHGSTKGITPFLDGVAAQSFTLDTNRQCSNWTFASTSCTLMGRSHIDNGFMPKLIGAEPFPEGTPFLAGWLGGAGYYSQLVSGNAWLGDEWGNSQGYDAYARPGGPRTSRIYEKSMEIFEDQKAAGKVGDRWFIHMHSLEPHAAYTPPDEYLTRLDDLEPVTWDLTTQEDMYAVTAVWPTMTEAEQDLLEAHLRVRYEGEIAFMDDQLAQNWALMQADGLLDDTLVVFWTDHGEQFWEHAKQTHAYSLYSEENDTIVWYWARNILPGRYTEPTSSIDVVPTVLTLLDLPIPPEVTGYPLGQAPEDRPIFAMTSARLGQMQSVVSDGWKLSYRWAGGVHLTHPGEDPTEADDFYDPANPDPTALALWDLLKPMVLAAVPLVPNTDPIWPDELP